MAIINKANLAHYLKLGYNVIFRGRHGVGKTAVIRETFEAAGLRWKYFSASTLDPWVDFVGMPRVKDHPDGTSTTELIRPSFIQHDEVECLFFDEYNRAPDKVLNATMELIQFGSINGHKLKNLKVIWAAINPEDEEDTYSVNHLDPAHIDRFQVQIDVPYKIDEEYFLAKYPKIGRQFIDWWEDLPLEIRYEVSPRRVDYAADAYQNNCRLEDFLPKSSNVKKLRGLLVLQPFIEQIKSIKTEAEAVAFIKNGNNATKLLDTLKTSESATIAFFKTYGKHIPGDLLEPYTDYLTAKEAGFEFFASMEEMIERLPTTTGNSGTAALINNVDYARMLAKSGSSLENELRNLAKTNPQAINKLANRCSDVILGCNAKTIERAFWGPSGRKNGAVMTPFQGIVINLGKIPNAAFSATKVTQMNNKLYQNKITDKMHLIGGTT